ncbi:HEAT repeat domain-containing protein [Leptospira ryugenii]|uniref:HEAT repeat domain-containing protein n=1 Tax=Leptospira ryugenii TaxID=1917863 RepID=UPI001FCED7DB|nr:HEAT repeat domain-containing protein [Leptospira ryugenii]
MTEEQILKKKEVLSKVLRYGTSQERKQALFELLSFPKEQANELYLYLGELLESEKDIGVKIVVLRTVGELNLHQFGDLVIRLFEDPNEDVTKQAISTAKKLKLTTAVGPLIEKVRKEDFTKSSNQLTLMINTLAELPNGIEASPFFQIKFKEKFNNSDTRAQIALYFGSVKDSSAESMLSDLAFDDAAPTTLRCYSINALGKIKANNAKSKLLELLDSLKKTAGKLDGKKAQSLKIYTIGALVLLGDKDVIQELNEFARDDDAMVRLRVIEHMGNLKDPSALDLLEYKRDRDPSPKVQKAAKRAIDQIKGVEVSSPEEESEKAENVTE